MTDKPQRPPVGYQTQPTARRMTRPLINRRKALLEVAEAVFEKKASAAPVDTKSDKQ